MKQGRQEAPLITTDTFDDTLAIANTMTDSDESLRYYTPARVDDSGEIAPVQYTPKQREMNVKVERREQHNQMLHSGKRVELEKFQYEKTDDHDSCTNDPTWQAEAVSKKTVVDLKKELKVHGLKVGGRKAELVERLLRHYEGCHAEKDDV